jgi:hypothetical protein
MRTDFSSAIDGALLGRNLGSRHFSDIARSGNGNMRTDLDDTSLKDYEELDGVGESMEDLSLQESLAVDSLGAMADVKRFRWPKPGETPPFASKPDKVWLRRKVITGVRRPGGNRVAKVKWAQVSKDRLVTLKNEGQLDGMGAISMSTIGISAGLGLAGGVVLWLLLKKRK